MASSPCSVRRWRMRTTRSEAFMPHSRCSGNCANTDSVGPLRERTHSMLGSGLIPAEVVVRSVETGGKVEYTPIGHTANLASRLQTLAPVGFIAVSEYTRKLCQGYFELRALGPMVV